MKYLKNFSLLAFAILFFSVNAQAQEKAKMGAAQMPAEIEQVSPVRAKLMVRNDGALMVDVREKDEVAALAYDVDGIILLPLSELSERMSELPKDKQLIMACRSGKRSSKAINLLMQNGYTNLVNLDGGIIAWESKELGVIKNGEAPVKKACCANPNKKDCNPDGTCKKGAKASKACCKKGAKDGKACCKKKAGKE